MTLILVLDCCIRDANLGAVQKVRDVLAQNLAGHVARCGEWGAYEKPPTHARFDLALATEWTKQPDGSAAYVDLFAPITQNLPDHLPLLSRIWPEDDDDCPCQEWFLTDSMLHLSDLTWLHTTLCDGPTFQRAAHRLLMRDTWRTRKSYYARDWFEPPENG